MSFIRNRLRALKIPRHTGRAKNWSEYFYNVSFPIESALEGKDVWTLVFMGAIALFVPVVWIFAFFYILFNTNIRIANRELSERPKELEQIVLFIQMNHLQSMTEAIETNPDLLYCTYKKNSLLYWCKYYNNTKALMVVIQLIKKFPRENDKLAA